MSNPWHDIGAIPQHKSAIGPSARLQFVTKWVEAGLYFPSFTKEELSAAIKECGLDRKIAAAWATKNLGWQPGWEIANNCRYTIPPADKVRDDWKHIPISCLTAAERKLSRFDQLHYEMASPKEMPK